MTSNIRVTGGSSTVSSGGTSRIENIVVTGTAATSTPTITLSSAAQLTFTTTEGTASAAQSYTVAGSNLTADISITAPTGYELALENPAGSGTPGTFAAAPAGSPLVLARTGSSPTIAATRIFVRLANTTTVAGSPYTGNLVHTSTGATQVDKPVSGTVTAPVAVPTITSFAPGNGPVGTSVIITGTNLTGATVTFNGTAAPGASVNGAGTQVTVTVPVGATTGTIAVTTPGGTATSATSFVVDPTPNPVPTISLLNPASITAGSPDFVLTVDGTGFLAGSSVSFNGTPRVTSYSSPTRLTVTILAADVATAGTYDVTVTNPAPGGGTSAAAQFTVIAAPTGTPCLTEGFESTTFPPSGWLATSVSRSTATGDIRNGVGSAIFGSATGQLTTPVLVSPTALTFYLGRSTNNTARTLIVEVATDGQTGTFTQIASFDVNNVPGGSYDQYTVPVPAPYNTAAQVWVRFRKASSTTAPWRLDDVAAYCGTPANAPQVSVTQGATAIPSGSGSYSFGSTTVAGTGTSATFALNNTGSADLTFASATPVTISGANAADFTVTLQPTGPIAGPAGTAPFSINFVPGATGPRTATVTITSNAAVYTFTVQGTGALPPANNAAAGLLLLEDNFNYAVGTPLTANGWTAHSGNATAVAEVVAGNLAHPNYALGSPQDGNKADVFGSSQDVNKPFTPSATTNVTYMAAQVEVAEALNGDYFLHLMNTGGSNVFRGRIYTRESGAGFNFGLSVSSGTITYAPTVYSFDQTYLLVLKYVTNPGGNDEASLYVTSAAAPLLEPATYTIGPLSEANSTPVLNAVAIRQDNNTPVVYLDGVRVATGWGAAISRPEYTEPNGTINAGNYYSVGVSGTNDRLDPNGAVVVEGNLNLDGGKIFTTAANSLTLRVGVTTQVSASGTSFVSGPLVRESVNAPSLFFPIGKGTNYRPLTLNISTAPAGITRYTAEQNEGVPADQTLLGDLKRVSRYRTYSVTPSPAPAAGTFSGTIELSFGTNDGVTDPSASSLVVAKSNGSGWENIGRSASTGTSTGGGSTAYVAGTLTSNVFTSFSDFALASTDPDVLINPLPVTLISFAAERQGEVVNVAWATASEKDNARFEVQRSADGNAFSTLESVEGHGTTTRRHDYRIVDRQPLATLAYYRLRQLDTNGKATFSPVVTVAPGKELALYPNPTRASLTLVAPATAATYRVISTVGSVVLEGQAPTGTATLDVAKLPAGLYQLEVTSAAGRTVRKFTKLD
ncbi:choice-of-anchor D domain-containing protein [Microvirga sp. STR05]|uniref:Choice-of-anchor D domain-containing protein n=1 Tax=Hymenobacter duratus TaxID=2771356 RepID=A0ABR8JHM2_9BACT|nr:choice-of-anchor D domain-containing protein [Hymenobacter duratus]MBD2716340.1 choice-of-anchor D domain-containing protein [Hymenobacter duratus]MBR7951255.1 choice-of-anchor D domain-containing protein [Microvirga sp. STR05]